MKNILSPSILSADLGNLARDIRETDRAGAPYVHIDVMDGVFVPQISFGMPLIRSIRPVSDQVFDVHLMIVDPERYIRTFADCGSDLITFHLEATKDPGRCFDLIRDCGKKAGISIKPGTPFSRVIPWLDRADMLLIMSVEPGFGGQALMPDQLDKIREARTWIDGQDRRIDLQVDGGIKLSNVRQVLDAGANVIVAGSAVFGGDIYENCRRFEEVLQGPGSV